MTDIQRRGLLASLASRLPNTSHNELRVLDLVLDRLERDRQHTPARLEDTLAAVGDELVRWAGRVLAERDQELAELHEAARVEMVGGPIDRGIVDLAVIDAARADASGIGVRVRTMANFATPTGAISPEALAELERANQHAIDALAISRFRTPESRLYYVIECAQAGVITSNQAREVLDELAEWHADAHLTRASDVPARIARTDIDDDEPYAEWDVTDLGGESG